MIARMTPLLLVVVLSAVLPTATAPQPSTDEPLRTLRRGHPRLLVHTGTFDAIRDSIRSDEQMRGFWRETIDFTESRRAARPPRPRVRHGRMLSVSRETFRTVTAFALRYRIEGNRADADRAIAELIAVCSFADWNPSHFLDTAEMSAAVALGYDWLHDALTEGQRRLVREALVHKGLEPGLRAYERREWWTDVDNNWAAVTAGGLALAALAVAEDEPALATRVLRITLQKMQAPMRTFAPDGGHIEGPSYWTYATRYTVLLLAALDSALGHDFGLSSMPGFDRAGDYRMHTISPARRAYNYADGSEGVTFAPQMHWLARRFNRPDFSRHELGLTPSTDVLPLLWYEPAARREAGTRPLDTCFRRVGVIVMRSSWDDRDALYLGIRGGNNAANHAHLDLGSFVLDALGQRFIVDPGTDDYNLPRFWGDNRWAYFRYRTEGHSTVLIDDESQRRAGTASVIAFRSTPQLAIGVLDLTDGYRGRVTSLRRGVAMVGRRHVLVRDEMTAGQPVEIAVLLQTTADVRIAEDGRSATLSRDGRSLVVRLHGDPQVRLHAEAIDLAPPQRKSTGHTRLQARWPGPVSRASLTMSFAPMGVPVEQPAATLQEWIDFAGTESAPR